MSFVTVNGVKLHYEQSGEGEETILFSHGLLFDTRLFEKQVAYFQNRYRCIAYDHRGQGQSQTPDDGFDMDTLTEDALQLIKTLNVGPCHVVGLSMGGFVGMRLAARHPELVKSLILLETSADEETNVFKYRLLSLIFRWFGAGPVASQIMNVLFGQKFLNDPQRKAERDFWRHEIARYPKTIVRAVAGVIERQPIIAELKNITAPTLVMVGNQDVATPPDKAERIHNHIGNSKLVVIKGAGHSASLEEPEQVNAAIEEFLRDLQDDFSADEA
ncbi:alpha/beta hydrolase [Sphingobacteriales bacterium UPWRP_1]|nr:alpha/beta hydrolase [Sphingobacteriales bacterium TSM_CSS]PSJ73980.1 alpha/beta hydrolase [Sphingobacteriales bacterium UPWRP_1]